MKLFKKIPWVSIVLGALLVIYGIVAFFVDKGVFALTNKVGQAIIGLGLVFFATFIVLPKIRFTENKTVPILRTIEFAIILLGAIIGFLLPLFNVEVPKIGSGSLWFGIAFVLDGGIGLFLGSHDKLDIKGYKFFSYLTFVILGTIISSKNLIDGNIKIAAFIAFLAMGGLLLIIGLTNIKKNNKEVIIVKDE